MKTKEELPACPVATTVSLIGSKWKLPGLRNQSWVSRRPSMDSWYFSQP